ncbi:MAG: [FeFe] hydrogenase H-cluster radical SAM maturase HydE [Proteobacteria bacterium]|nr:[FeFe] hydrogenase H-cluster radical SAM maturase HydE [Pseudomonadota bacterium]
MCLTVPVKIKKLEGTRALIDGEDGELSLELAAAPDVRAGDWVLHVNGLVIKKIPTKDAKQILDLLEGVNKNIKSLEPSSKLSHAIEAVKSGTPEITDIEYLLNREGAEKEALFLEAGSARREHIKDFICIHGIIEFSNHCEMDCTYCGLRSDNTKLERYRMEPDEIIECAVDAIEKKGYKLIILQSGEDSYYTDDKLVNIIEEIKKRCRCFLFLSSGERGYESYKRLKRAGASGVLLRFETSNETLFKKIHPRGKDFSSRFEHLKFLRELGFFIATGSLIGLPGQTSLDIARDILAIKKFANMATIGPFIATPGTPLEGEVYGETELTLKAVSIIRLLMKKVRLPVVTAFETLSGEDGRRRALNSGANSLMLNLTPEAYRTLYSIYPDKFFDSGSIWERYGLFNYTESYAMLEETMAKEIGG